MVLQYKLQTEKECKLTINYPVLKITVDKIDSNHLFIF